MTAHDRAGERPDACPRCHGTGKDPAGFGSPDPWACMTCGGAGERADAIPAAVWRVGRKVGRTIYVQLGPEPSDNDELIGVMDEPKLAQTAVEAVNAYVLRAAHPEAGSEEAEWLRTELERARARDANMHKRVRERLGQIHGKGYSFVEAVSDLERLATHPVWEQAEQATVDLERAEAEAERLDERARINARYAGKLSAERDEARAEVERLRDAVRAFVRETGVAHPAIARIPADAPAAVRYDETRAALLALLDAHPEADPAPDERASRQDWGTRPDDWNGDPTGVERKADRAPEDER